MKRLLLSLLLLLAAFASSAAQSGGCLPIAQTCKGCHNYLHNKIIMQRLASQKALYRGRQPKK